MTPIVRYFILCDRVDPHPDNPKCVRVECVMSNIHSVEEPPFPLLRDRICAYFVLTDCRGIGSAQVRVVHVDPEPSRELFGSPIRALDFRGKSPLDALGLTFTLADCWFPVPGRYSVQFWYNDALLAECPLRLW